MPRYFFHVRDGRSFEDKVGTESDDDDQARKGAMAASLEGICAMGVRFWSGDGWQMQVVTSEGREVVVLHCQGMMRQPAEQDS